MRRSRLLLAVALCASAVLQACDENEREALPKLAQGLPNGSWTEADIVFKARIRELFPLGASEQDVVRVLKVQGFALSPDRKSASFEQAAFVCRHVWRVFWKTDESMNLRGISGTYGGICL